jgi:hypothetical protein
MINLIHYRYSLGRDLNPESLDHEAGVLSTHRELTMSYICVMACSHSEAEMRPLLETWSLQSKPVIALQGDYGDCLLRSYSQPAMRDWMEKFPEASNLLQRMRGRHPSLSEESVQHTQVIFLHIPWELIRQASRGLQFQASAVHKVLR